MKRLIIIEKKSDDEFIAKDEERGDYVVFKGDETKTFKTIEEAREYLEGRWDYGWYGFKRTKCNWETP